MRKKLIFVLTLGVLFSCSLENKNTSSKTNGSMSFDVSSNLPNEEDTYSINTDSSSSMIASIEDSNDTNLSSKESEKETISSSELFSSLSEIQSSSISSTSSSIKEDNTAPSPITKGSYLEGALYGDEGFIKKCRDSEKREIETIEDIPSNAIFIAMNGNDSNDGSIDRPLLTLSKALSKASANIKNNEKGVIIFREGVYDKTYFYSLAQGTSENYLTITNYPSEEVKISAKGGNETTGLFHLGTSNYVIVEGLIFCDNIGSNVAKAITCDGNGVSHIILKHNEITNIKVTGSSANAPLCSFRGINDSKSINNILIYDNFIHDCVCGWSEAITAVGNCEYFNIIQNKIYNTGNIGIDIAGNWGDVSSSNDQARNVVARGNDVSCCNSPYATSYALYVDGARDVLFENNFAYNSQGGIEIGSENINTAHPVKNITVRNNVVFNNERQGITLGGYNPSVAGYCYDIKLYNNTIVNNGTKNSGQLKLSMVDNVDVKNNIFYSDYNYALVSGELDISYTTNVTMNNNLFYAGVNEQEAYFRPSNNAINGFENFLNLYNDAGYYSNPNFLLDEKHPYSLNKDSIAINKGIEVETSNYDSALLNRHNGIIDIGAYEYQDTTVNISYLMDLIDNLPSVSLNNEFKEILNECLNLYNSLSNEEKYKVTNASILQEKETEYNNLLISTFKKTVLELEEFEYTSEYKLRLDYAFGLYNDLSSSLKNNVKEEYETLTTKNQYYEDYKLVDEFNRVYEELLKVDEDNLTYQEVEIINKLLNMYNNFTTSQIEILNDENKQKYQKLNELKLKSEASVSQEESLMYSTNFIDETRFAYENGNTNVNYFGVKGSVYVNNPLVITSNTTFKFISQIEIEMIVTDKGSSSANVYYSTNKEDWILIGNTGSCKSNGVAQKFTLTPSEMIKEDVFIKIEATCSKAQKSAKDITISLLNIYGYGSKIV